MSDDLTVVIPTWNRSALLERAVVSVPEVFVETGRPTAIV